MDTICDIELDCTGCEACCQTCKHDAIRMEYKADGFGYPSIDKTKCVECGLCKKICPSNSTVSSNASIPYLAYSLNTADRLDSSSGGVFSVIAKYVLQKKGIVYGAAYDDTLTLRHISIENENDMHKLRGSKYVQSYIGKTYEECYQQLTQGRLVYFMGTPCQIAGLKTFLHHDYSNLITSDFICHGVPSGQLFKEYIEQYQRNNNLKILDYKFRSKKRFGQGIDLELLVKKRQKNKVIFLCAESVPFFYGFWKNMTLRESCYRCKYSKTKRVSDITLADFWTVKKFFPKMKTSDGISLMLVNSDKGKTIFDSIKKDMYVADIPSGIKSIGQAHLEQPVKRPASRDILQQGLSYQELCNSILHIPYKYKMKVHFRNFIKTIILYKYWK